MSDQIELNPLHLSHKIGKLVPRWRRFASSGGASTRNESPFLGEFPGLSAFRQVQDLPEHDPLRLPLLRWVHRLTDARIHIPWAHHDAELSYRQKHALVLPFETSLSLSEIRKNGVSSTFERSSSSRKRTLLSSEGERAQWWMALEGCEAELSAHRIERWARYHEVSTRLGVSSQDEMWSPLGKPQGEEVEQGFFLDRLAEQANVVLELTDDAAQAHFKRGWASLAEALSAHEAPEGWPARLALDSLRELWGMSDLFRGLDLSLSLPPLPARLCPQSFPRAAATMGRALCVALIPHDVPFVRGRDPDDLLGHEIAELFHRWSCSPVFQARKLGLSQRTLEEYRRHWALAQLASLRLAAARLLIMRGALTGTRVLERVFEETTRRLLGRSLPLSSALARFEIRHDEPARFVAFFSAARRETELRNSYDEDWYESPRAQEQLRAEISLPASRERNLDNLRVCTTEILERLALG